MHLCLITSLTHFDAVDFECTQCRVILSISWSPQIWCSFSGGNSLFQTFLLGWSVRVGGRGSMPGSCRSSLAMRHPKMKDYDEDACDWRYRWLFAGWTFCLAICRWRRWSSQKEGEGPFWIFLEGVAIWCGCPVSKMTVSFVGRWRTFQPRCLGYDQGLCFGVIVAGVVSP